VTALPQTSAPPAKSKTSDPLAAEQRAFERQRARLLQRHLGQYVAFYRGRMVDHDKDDEAMAARWFAELGDVPFFIARVERTPTVYDVPSPAVNGPHQSSLVFLISRGNFGSSAHCHR